MLCANEMFCIAQATSHLSGGQLNPVVSFALVCVKALSPLQGLVNICCQIVGAILGSSFLYATIPSEDRTTLGSNVVAPGVSNMNAFCGEAVMTFTLVLVVLETAVNKKSVARAQVRKNGPRVHLLCFERDLCFPVGCTLVGSSKLLFVYCQ